VVDVAARAKKAQAARMNVKEMQYSSFNAASSSSPPSCSEGKTPAFQKTFALIF
jgi:hypothetical protein